MAMRKFNIYSLTNLESVRKSINIKKASDLVINALADEGEKIILAARAAKGYKDRTYNLHDSYVSAVFKDGVLLPETIRYVGPKMAKRTHGRTIPGREHALDFLSSVGKRIKKKGIALVVGAAMPYSSILERKWGLNVISSADMDLRRLASRGIRGAKGLSYFAFENEFPYVYRLKDFK